MSIRHATNVADPGKDKRKKVPGLRTWLKEQVLHLYHGFRLLAVNARIALRLRRQMRRGQQLTRRERQLLEVTTNDLIRLVPFSVFVIVPAAEVLLPIALLLFPNLMPSTFTTSSQRRRKQIMENLKAGVSRKRLFEFMTSKVLLHEKFNSNSPVVPVFRAIHEGAVMGQDSLRCLVPHFDVNGPLALKKIPGYILRDLNVRIGKFSAFERMILPKTWYAVRMRFMIEQELERMEADDLELSNTDLSSLTPRELENECAIRRMRWYGSPEELRSQLTDWLALSLDPDVPNHLLLFVAPRATPDDAVLDYFSKEERDHVLGLEGYKDTPQYQLISKMTKQKKREKKQRKAMQDLQSQEVLQEEQAAVSNALPEEFDLEELKLHIENVKEENRATEDQLGEVCKVLKNLEEDDLSILFDRLEAHSAKVNDDGDPGVDVEKLSRGLAGLLRQVHFEEEPGRRKSFQVTPSQITSSLREFDIDDTDIITRQEYKEFLNRIRMPSLSSIDAP